MLYHNYVKERILIRYSWFLFVPLFLIFASVLQGCGSTHSVDGGQAKKDDIYTIPKPISTGRFYVSAKTGKPGFENATQKNTNLYVFGEGEDALYVHVKTEERTNKFGNKIKFIGFNVGGNNINNTFQIGSDPQNVKIFKTVTKEGVSLYILNSTYDITCDYTILGRKKDGTFIKYIDTKDITQNYFGNQKTGGIIVYDKTIQTQENMFILDCFYYKLGAKNFPGDKVCRFIFRWNENNQSFDVEQTDIAMPNEKEKASTANSSAGNQGDIYACTKAQHGIGAVDYYVRQRTLRDIDEATGIFEVNIKMIPKHANGQVEHRYIFSYNSQEGKWYWKNVEDDNYHALPEDLIQLVDVCIPFSSVARKYNG